MSFSVGTKWLEKVCIDSYLKFDVFCDDLKLLLKNKEIVDIVPILPHPNQVVKRKSTGSVSFSFEMQRQLVEWILGLVFCQGTKMGTILAILHKVYTRKGIFSVTTDEKKAGCLDILTFFKEKQNL